MSRLDGRRHRCGGRLDAASVLWRVVAGGGLMLVYTGSGVRCTRCGTELLDRDMARSRDAGQTPTIVWAAIPPLASSTALSIRPLTASTTRGG